MSSVPRAANSAGDDYPSPGFGPTNTVVGATGLLAADPVSLHLRSHQSDDASPVPQYTGTSPRACSAAPVQADDSLRLSFSVPSEPLVDSVVAAVAHSLRLDPYDVVPIEMQRAQVEIEFQLLARPFPTDAGSDVVPLRRVSKAVVERCSAPSGASPPLLPCVVCSVRSPSATFHVHSTPEITCDGVEYLTATVDAGREVAGRASLFPLLDDVLVNIARQRPPDVWQAVAERMKLLCAESSGMRANRRDMHASAQETIASLVSAATARAHLLDDASPLKQREEFLRGQRESVHDRREKLVRAVERTREAIQRLVADRRDIGAVRTDAAPQSRVQRQSTIDALELEVAQLRATRTNYRNQLSDSTTWQSSEDRREKLAALALRHSTDPKVVALRQRSDRAKRIAATLQFQCAGMSEELRRAREAAAAVPVSPERATAMVQQRRTELRTALASAELKVQELLAQQQGYATPVKRSPGKGSPASRDGRSPAVGVGSALSHKADQQRRIQAAERQLREVKQQIAKEVHHKEFLVRRKAILSKHKRSQLGVA